MPQVNLAGGLNFVITIDIFEWLIITGKGQGLNFSSSVAPNTTQLFEINPPAGSDYLLYHAIQWDGITPGLVTFDMRGGTNTITAGFAVQAFIQNELFITDHGKPIRVFVNNGSTSPIVLNVDYVALSSQIWSREILPFISPVIPGGH